MEAHARGESSSVWARVSRGSGCSVGWDTQGPTAVRAANVWTRYVLMTAYWCVGAPVYLYPILSAIGRGERRSLGGQAVLLDGRFWRSVARIHPRSLAVAALCSHLGHSAGALKTQDSL